MKATSPNGTPIIGTLERVPACALMRSDSYTRAPDGSLIFVSIRRAPQR